MRLVEVIITFLLQTSIYNCIIFMFDYKEIIFLVYPTVRKGKSKEEE